MRERRPVSNVSRGEFYLYLAVTWGFMLIILSKQLDNGTRVAWHDYVFFGVMCGVTLYFAVVSGIEATRRSWSGEGRGEREEVPR